MLSDACVSRTFFRFRSGAVTYCFGVLSFLMQWLRCKYATSTLFQCLLSLIMWVVPGRDMDGAIFPVRFVLCTGELPGCEVGTIAKGNVAVSVF